LFKTQIHDGEFFQDAMAVLKQDGATSDSSRAPACGPQVNNRKKNKRKRRKTKGYEFKHSQRTH
jgi:hypothetical protein